MTTIVTYQDEYQSVFEQLNRDWIERYFRLEESDMPVLRDPRRAIIDCGGEVFVGLIDGRALGVCAMRYRGGEEYELAKLAVRREAQGCGLGRELWRALIAEVRRRGGRRIIIETNSRLLPAVGLYKSLGFEAVEVDFGEVHYARVDLVMMLEL